MKRTPSFLRTQTLVALYLLVLEMSLLAQGTAFTYQGRLFDDGSPATGNYDLTFSLWNAASGPAQVGSTITNANTPVSNGLFAVTLDFGSTAFNGQARWLQIAAPAKGGGFTNLVPRQALTATPYAITAGNLTGAPDWEKNLSAKLTALVRRASFSRPDQRELLPDRQMELPCRGIDWSRQLFLLE